MKIKNIEKSEKLFEHYNKVNGLIAAIQIIDDKSSISIGDDNENVVYGYDSLANDPRKIGIDVLTKCRQLILAELEKNKLKIEMGIEKL